MRVGAIRFERPSAEWRALQLRKKPGRADRIVVPVVNVRDHAVGDPRSAL
jgi:hypothetical protein